MLSKAHLTTHSWMSGSRWVITPSWLSCIFIIIPMHIPMHYSYAYSLLFLLWLISLTGLQSPCSPRDSLECSPASQLESINSSPLSLLYGPTLTSTSAHDYWKNHNFGLCTFVGKVMSLLFNMLSRFVVAFLPRSKRLLISWLQSLEFLILQVIRGTQDRDSRKQLRLQEAAWTPPANIRTSRS